VLLVFGALARFVARGPGARPDHPISGLVRGCVGSMYFEKIIEAKRVGSIASAAGSMSALPPKADIGTQSVMSALCQ